MPFHPPFAVPTQIIFTLLAGKVSMSVLPMKLVKSDWVWVSVVHTKKALWRSDVAW